MPLEIVRNDIINMRCDAIVNAANSLLIGGGGVDGAIHRAAGPELDRACAAVGGCEPGQAKMTLGYNLPCKYIIHTVGPIWTDGSRGEEETLASCYRESLRLAWEHGCETAAFPLISAGTYGCPRETALEIAVREISKFLLSHDMLIFLVIYDRASFQISKKLISGITEYIDECYVEAHDYGQTVTLSTRYLDREARLREMEDLIANSPFPGSSKKEEPPVAAHTAPQATTVSESLDDIIKRLDESFSQMLLRKIDEKGMTDAECYKKANIDRKLFSKIRGDVRYKPSKTTAIAFAIALELPLGETEDFLRKAGFALSHSNKFDVIVEYFIRNGNYNIFEINEALFYFDQSLLGAQ